MMKKILLVTAHPDDAEISMGGTIRKLLNQGHYIINIIFSIPSNIKVRKQEAMESSKNFGYEVQFSKYSEGKNVEDIPMHILIKELDEIIEKINPDEVYTHWMNDSHQDHQKLSKVVRSCFRKKQFTLYEFEQINQNNNIAANQFHPNIYSDITEFMEDKKRMITLFQSQLSGYMGHYLVNAEHIGSWRGSQVNCKYAETFLLIFSIEVL